MKEKYSRRSKFHGSNNPVAVENFDNDDEDSFIRLYPNDMALIPTGLIFFLPDTHHLKFYSRSGNVWKRLLTVANQPAVIDSDYVLESFVLVHNKSNRPQIIKHGEAVAQCELCRNNDIVFGDIDKDKYNIMLEEAANKSSRDGGFGSTDK